MFKLDPTGKETVLHSFNPYSTYDDGWFPEYGSLLRDSSGDLFGTTTSVVAWEHTGEWFLSWILAELRASCTTSARGAGGMSSIRNLGARYGWQSLRHNIFRGAPLMAELCLSWISVVRRR